MRRIGLLLLALSATGVSIAIYTVVARVLS